MSRHTEFIPFSRPRISHEEEAAVLRVLRSGWVTTGRECLSFEEEFAELLVVKHALAMNSSTACLQIGLHKEKRIMETVKKMCKNHDKLSLAIQEALK